MGSALVSDVVLGAAEFEEIARIVHAVAGIRLPPGKEGLVRARLARRLRLLGVPSFAAYVAHVQHERGRAELAEMVDALTTNKTDFFREAAHFDYLRERVLAARAPGAPLRFWSAGCSSGEEPYTLAVVLRESLPDVDRRDVRILATDISRRVLAHARAGSYSDAALEGVPEPLRRRHFARTPDGAWQASPSLRRLVTFAPLNLVGPWPMKGPFDAILCRNVMIYFDKATQQRLVDRYWRLLPPGGHLFVGHAESLSGLQHRFRYVQPAVYAR
jgi:chemotaxis protein methyltransferase CheR